MNVAEEVDDQARKDYHYLNWLTTDGIPNTHRNINYYGQMVQTVQKDISTADEQMNALLAMEGDQSKAVVNLLKMKKQMEGKLAEFNAKLDRQKKNIQGLYRAKNEYELKLKDSRPKATFSSPRQARASMNDEGYASSSPCSSPKSYKAHRLRQTRFSPAVDVEQSTSKILDPHLHSVASPSVDKTHPVPCLLYTSPSPRDRQKSRMPSSA